MRKTLLIAASTFVLGVGTMAYIGQAARATTEANADTYHMLQLFGDVLDQVDRQYVSPVDDKKLIQSAMQGMLSSLDPHSDYLSPEAYGDLQAVRSAPTVCPVKYCYCLAVLQRFCYLGVRERPVKPRLQYAGLDPLCS